MPSIRESSIVRAGEGEITIVDLANQADRMKGYDKRSSTGALPAGTNAPFNANSRVKTISYLINLDTFQRLSLQFNPTDIPWGRSAKFSEIVAPGMSYPKTQYVGGEAREFDFDCFYYDKPYSGKIKEAMDYFEELMPPYWNDPDFEKPPLFTINYGFLHCTCVLKTISVKEMQQDEDGNPIMATINLAVRQVGT